MSCDFKTDSQGLLKTHMVRVHGEEKEKSMNLKNVGKPLMGKIYSKSTLKLMFVRLKRISVVMSVHHLNDSKRGSHVDPHEDISYWCNSQS